MNTVRYRTLYIEHDGRGVARVTLHRPEVLNAFDETMIDELADAFASLAHARDARVIVLAGSGRAFSAGADLRWMERAAANPPEANLDDARRFAAMLHLVQSCPQPVIARIHGAAFGGGVGLCCACDIALASRQATFAVSEARFGILPSVIGPYLNNAVGKRHALMLALTTAAIDAPRAADIGLVHQVLPLDELDAAIDAIVARLLANGPQALGEIKRWFGQLRVGPVDETVREYSAQTIARVRAGAEAREGFAAYLGKRPAAWGAP